MTLATKIASTVDIHLSLIKLDNIPRRRWLGHSNYRICLKVDGIEYNSVPVSAKASIVNLEDTFTFPITLSSRLELQLLCSHQKVRKDHVISEAAIQLFEIARHEDITIDWAKPGSNKRGDSTALNRGSVTVHLKVDSTYRSTAASSSGAVIKALQDDLELSPPQWTSLLISLNALVTLAGVFAQIDPNAKIAFKAVSFAFEMMVMQVLRDERINSLVSSMANLYSFVHDANALEKITSLEGTVVRLIQQTTECAYFITAYIKTDSFMQRAVTSTISNVDALITAFEVAFGELKIEFIMGTALQTALISVRILEKVDNITNLIHVNTLPYMQGASFNPSRMCLRGTCTSLIDEINNWIITGSVQDRIDTSRIFLLLGGTRCGKSSVSHTIAQRLQSEGRLGSAIFFAKDDVERNTPQLIFSTMARKLAAFDQAIKEAIAHAIDRDPDLPSAAIERQFQDLILNPIRHLTLVGPIVIIIDGLDECNERDALLNVITEEFIHLPSNFRILITARPELDIVEWLQGLDHCHVQEMTFDDGSPGKTIDAFISEKLSELEAKRPNIFNNHYTRAKVEAQLATRAMGLNVWATTACKFLSVISDDEAVLFLATAILSETISKNPEETMNHLYHSILSIVSSPAPAEASCHELGRENILGMLALAKPNSTSHAAGSDRLCIQETSTEFRPIDILIRIGCLRVQVNDNSSQHILVLDQPFVHFITDARRCTLINRQKLAQDYLNVMNQLLICNMLGINDKSLLNSEIPGKKERIKECVPQVLQYAAQYWAMHLTDIEPSEDVMEKLHEFFFKHLLHWIELSSLLGLHDRVLPSLTLIDEWFKCHKCASSDLETMVYDAICFARAFSDVISETAQHTYISSLTFTPHRTFLYRNFCHTDNIERPEVTEGAEDVWSYHETMEGHKDRVESVAFSHDGLLIASGSHDKTVQIWDARTRRVVKVIDAVSGVNSVAFSPDGSRIASGLNDNSVRLWDVHTGQAIFEPLLGHSTRVTSVVYSPDGSRIVSGSYGGKLRVWDATTGKAIGGPLVGHFNRIHRVVFSPDGLLLASGSVNGIIQLWDIKRREIMGKQMRHGQYVWDLCWSPDGSLIASCGNEFVALWDSSTREMQRKLESSGGPIWSIAFSPDGSQLFGGSGNGILHLWDIKTGNRKGELKGHTRCIHSIAMSPDGLRIISGSDDRSIRLWDISPYHTLHSPSSENSLSRVISPTLCTVDIDPIKGIASDGWIYTSSGKRYLWVPAQYRGELSVSSDSLTIRCGEVSASRQYWRDGEKFIKIRSTALY